MTDVVHLSSAALRRALFAAPLERSLYRATIANGTRRALDDLPDNLLKDIGLARDDLPFVAGELAFGGKDSNREARNLPAGHRLPSRVLVSLTAVAVAAVLTFAVLSRVVFAQDGPIALQNDRVAQVVSAHGQVM